jgi:hypothetical protein
MSQDPGRQADRTHPGLEVARGEIDYQALAIARNKVGEPPGEKLEIAILGHGLPARLRQCLPRKG